MYGASLPKSFLLVIVNLFHLATEVLIGDVRLDLLSRTIEAFRQTNTTSSLSINTSGSYFLPSPVDGRLTNIKVFGNVGDDVLRSVLGSGIDFALPTVRPHVYALVYRPDDNGMAYNLLYGPTLVTHEIAPNSTHLDVRVRRDDLIGVLIPKECTNRTNDIPLCPSQPNLAVKGKCLSAFFHPMNNNEMLRNVIPTDEFTEELVDLSVKITVIPTSGMYKATIWFLIPLPYQFTLASGFGHYYTASPATMSTLWFFLEKQWILCHPPASV